jgi:hypothetical protein
MIRLVIGYMRAGIVKALVILLGSAPTSTTFASLMCCIGCPGHRTLGL